jgi:curli biogenesis system outer membrane secretion channel CsgG
MLAALSLCVGTASAQPDRTMQDGKLGITKVEVLPALRQASANAGRVNSLDRVVQSLDAQLISAFNETRKFEVVAWSDLKDVIDVASAGQAFEARSFAYAGAKYMVAITVDDFQDFEQVTELPNLGRTYAQRLVRVSAVARIYDTSNGSVVHTANIQASTDLEPESVNAGGTGPRLTDEMLQAMSRQLCERIAERVTDVIFPMRVVARSGNTVTLNRGDGFNLVPGMEFDVFIRGEPLIDPDTGRALGREESLIGRVRLTAVAPETSRAEIVSGTLIERGAVARVPQP